ncbi:thiamine diphosphate-binding protein [Entophlyctis helioformis]|nr:thiamine diphosphate-binding protein [Entophlyctis helioformis]
MPAALSSVASLSSPSTATSAAAARLLPAARATTPTLAVGLARSAAHIHVQQRAYHYDRDVYGYRTPRVPTAREYTPEELDNRNKNANLLRLVYAFRNHGHRLADLDPLNLTPQDPIPSLNPTRYGIKESGEVFPLAGILSIPEEGNPSVLRTEAPIEVIVEHLKNSYSGRLGFEFTHIPLSAERRWFSELVETYHSRKFSGDEKKYFASLLTRSEVFDHFMAKKFPQVKRYGLEGAESMMIALYTLFREASVANLQDVVLCMPHRGRLNLLTGMLNYPAANIFRKVKGQSELPDDLNVNADVLSHLAISTDINVGGPKPIHVSMLHNPSHLETANPVALGKARARQMHLYDSGTETDCWIGDRVMCLQLHGDAAFTGQGVVTETLGLSNLPHFTAGGSVHVIVNNQIGYTTPAMNARSTVYTSDVGKMINCPVIHVNADHPEDVAYAAAIAFEYRHKFRKDVILDLISYRRLGHNELDEPAYTQPLMYKKIRSLKTVPAKYEEKMVEEGVFASRDEVDGLRQYYFGELEKKLEESYTYKPEMEAFKGKWSKMRLPTEAVTKIDSGVAEDTLKEVGLASVQTVDGLKVHSRIARYHIENRVSKVNAGTKLDWATGEALAFGTLLQEGYNVRISGQDVGRGTFSQRHAMLVDGETERTIIPLNLLKSKNGVKPGKLEIANSHLSEYAVLAYEYGVSWETPNRLCIWEAQFGDFFNGAQIVIDTLISSGETKWLRQSGLVMLLPHGYDGAGPEHSSSHIERFLQLCDHPFDVKGHTDASVNPNMHVVNPTTPAQYFHVLRRQMVRDFRKPLIVMSPKILLRHPAATSDLADMAPGTTFLPVLPDPAFPTASAAAAVKRVIFVSGKLYYDLVKEREAQGKDADVALVRVEELSPFPTADLAAEVARFPNATEHVWVQEESQNQGAYSFVAPRLQQLVPGPLGYHGRAASAAPATGIGAVHKKEHEYVVKGAFAGL